MTYVVWWSDTPYSEYMQDFKERQEALDFYSYVNVESNEVRLFKELKVETQTTTVCRIVEEES